MCIQGEERRRRQSVLVGSKGSGLTLDYGKPANCQRGMNDQCARSVFFPPPKNGSMVFYAKPQILNVVDNQKITVYVK